jgi:hypothetical protein
MHLKKKETAIAFRVRGAVTARAIGGSETTVVSASIAAGAAAAPLLAGLPGDM